MTLLLISTLLIFAGWITAASAINGTGPQEATGLLIILTGVVLFGVYLATY